MHPLLSAIFFALPILNISYSQIDTIVSYDVRTKETVSIIGSAGSSATKFESTSSYTGTTDGKSMLSLSPPANTFPGSGFTDFMPAQLTFAIDNYPIRCAVKIFVYVNDTLRHGCTGVMISEDMVLTASHCLFTYDDSGSTTVFRDSVLVIPAYDNGKENPIFGNSVSAKYYIPKSNMIYPYTQDIALIKLREPLGQKTGWIGMSFFAPDTNIIDKVFHKLSYPGTVDPSDSTRVYNGDTLYYNYGKLDIINNTEYGYFITGVPGQSGSSLFFSDNNIDYYSIGVLNWSHNSRHFRINRNIFYAFKNIITGTLNVTTDNRNFPNQIYLSNAYPNPFNPSTTIEFEIPNKDFVEICVYDIIGREVRKLVSEEKPAGRYRIQFHSDGLSSGIYYYTLQTGSHMITKKCLLLQ